MSDNVSIDTVHGGIHDSIIAGRDVEVIVNIISHVGEQPTVRNLPGLLLQLEEALPHLDDVQATSTRSLIKRLQTAIVELPLRENEYLTRVSERYKEGQPYYVPLSAETTELNQPDSTATPRPSARRRQRRAMADYREWIPAQREIVRVRLENLEEGINKYPCIILLGDPGSGKTTALEMIALELAQSALASDRDLPPMLPVPLRLSEYEPGMGVEDFIAQGWSGSILGDHWEAGALASNLLGYLEQGRLFFLFDAINEMPREGYTERVTQLRQFVDRWQATGNRFVATCRVLDYSEELQGLQRIEIMPLSNEQITRFVLSEITSGDHTCEVIWNLLLEAQTPGESQRLVALLEAEMSRAGLMMQWEALSRALAPQEGSDHAGLLEMARNPYLLTVIIDVFLDQGRVDLTRSALMESFVNIQLNWARSKVPAQDWLDMSIQQESLSVLAFETQRRSRFGTLVRTDQAKAVMPATVQPDPDWPPVPAPPDRVLNLAASANIVEMPTDRSTVRFYHQLLQEYFAARSLLKRDFASLTQLWRWPWQRSEMPDVGPRGEYDPLPLPPVTGWEETTILATELAQGKHEPLLRRVVEANPVLAGRCLAETQIQVSPSTREAVVGAILTTIANPAVSLRVRIAAGDVLGHLNDPRIGDLVTISGGATRLGGRTGAVREVDLPGYRIGRYPVTNLEYAGFVEAGGYDERRWWTDAGWQWKGEVRFPDNWEDAWFNRPNYPVVGVAWYEAAAFCRWLSAESGRQARLPTEDEWENAASGGEDRRFPWGDEFGADRLNIKLGPEPVNRTTPVGIYADGVSPHGLLDCAGQVWEWCLTPTTPEYALAPRDQARPAKDIEEGSLGRILRGGSWSDRADEVAECAYREWFYADFRSSDRGFRIVVIE